MVGSGGFHMWVNSGWRITTSAGLTIAASTPIGMLQLGGSIGAIYVASTKGGTVHSLRYSSLGAGISSGLPVSISVSTPDFPGGGIGTILARTGGSQTTTAIPPRRGVVAKVRLEELLGPCQIAIVELAVRGGAVSGAMISFNLDSITDDPVTAIDHCRARGLYWGTSLGIQGGGDGSIYRGNIHLAS